MLTWTIDRLDAPEMFRVRLGGEFNVAAVRRMLDELSEKKGDFPFVPVLVDNRGLDLSGVSDDDLFSVGGIFLVHNPSFAYSKFALLMNPGSNVELASQFEIIARPVSDSIFSVFSDEEKALQWLAN